MYNSILELAILKLLQSGVGSIGIPPKTGDFLVTFYTYNGIPLKYEWVDRLKSATAPEIPIHDSLEFQEWNNSFDRILEDTDICATMITKDRKTHFYINRKTINTSNISLYFTSNNSLSNFYLDFGDGSPIYHRVGFGTFQVDHTYSDDKDYIIKFWSTGEPILLGTTSYPTGFNSTLGYIITKVFFGDSITINTTVSRTGMFRDYELEEISLPNHPNIEVINPYFLYGNRNLEFFGFPRSLKTTFNNIVVTFSHCPKLKRVVFSDTQLNISIDNMFVNCAINIRSFTNRKILINRTGSAMSSVLTAQGTNSNNIVFLEKVVIPQNCLAIGNSAFSGCVIKEFIMNIPNNMVTLSSVNAFASISYFDAYGLSKFYFHDDFLEHYKTATNWIVYSNYFLPLSQNSQYSKISFNSNGGSNVTSMIDVKGELFSAPANPTKNGFIFGGWFIDEELTQEFTFSENYQPLNNIILYAKWVE